MQLGLDCPLHVSQNDGTLMSADFARRYPVATFASGPANSMRGAAFSHQQVVVGDLIGFDHLLPAARPHHLQHPQPTEVGIAAAARSQHCRSQSDRRQIRLSDLPHGTPPAATARQPPTLPRPPGSECG